MILSNAQISIYLSEFLELTYKVYLGMEILNNFQQPITINNTIIIADKSDIELLDKKTRRKQFVIYNHDVFYNDLSVIKSNSLYYVTNENDILINGERTEILNKTFIDMLYNNDEILDFQMSTSTNVKSDIETILFYTYSLLKNKKKPIDTQLSIYKIPELEVLIDGIEILKIAVIQLRREISECGPTYY